MSSAALPHAPVNELSLCKAFVIWSVEVNTEVSRLPKSEHPNLMQSFGNIFFCTRQSDPVISCRRTCLLVSPRKLPCISTGDGLLLLTSADKNVSQGQFQWCCASLSELGSLWWPQTYWQRLSSKHSSGRDQEQTILGR